ncbi:uncharacterized protein LOC121736770 [Aricia agestis]|uniref:uncharacterized protein LOC121736770 n=1 Tax=Aricia agestis TaxID=91739 RepID=UPI001C20206E|nr:uncharacterized protein LOC121736770 [Aricia agestis]
MAEAAVRSTKFHLRRILNLTHLTYEEMSTCLAQIEAILNSRPLTPFSSDPSDLLALTPSHFLIGRTLTTVPNPQISEDININQLQRFRRVEIIKQHFWQRYANDYIYSLQQKTKWHHNKRDLMPNTLVLIKDKMAPPLLWSLGRVEKVFPGVDGVNRVAQIKTAKGVIRRAWNNICALPMEEDTFEAHFNRGSMSNHASSTCIGTERGEGGTEARIAGRGGARATPAGDRHSSRTMATVDTHVASNN